LIHCATLLEPMEYFYHIVSGHLCKMFIYFLAESVPRNFF
jgi:hypothetical protein